MNNAKIIGPNFVTVMINGVTHTVTKDHANYNLIRDALKKNDYKAAAKYINVAKAVESYVGGKVKVTNGVVMYGKDELKGPVVERILQMLREGFDAQPMINFVTNLMKNPSKRAIDELYSFLESSNLPITEDGCFLAYKKVNNNFKDFYTGTMDNSVGKVLEMERNKVDDDKDRTCSHGLHFCSLSYLPHYHGGQGKVMIVKINPADVVSIPSDYNNAKGRAAKYEVIGEHTGGEDKHAFSAPVYTNTGAPATATVGKVAPQSGNPSLLGYNAGRSAASKGKPYDTANGFAGVHSDRYTESYRKGWNSVKNVINVLPVTNTTEVDDDEGDDDSDWNLLGYDNGYADADAKRAYDDNEPPGCDDPDEYKGGYADGWYDSKKNN